PALPAASAVTHAARDWSLPVMASVPSRAARRVRRRADLVEAALRATPAAGKRRGQRGSAAGRR
ncbi:hypothetical protein, partial [Micromonospora sp. WP24]|uniref:hypothetical protein n=1 Tax=Micromonospora sp. WP24 TaxID=2604469 RepID=UPI001CA35960